MFLGNSRAKVDVSCKPQLFCTVLQLQKSLPIAGRGDLHPVFLVLCVIQGQFDFRSGLGCLKSNFSQTS